MALTSTDRELPNVIFNKLTKEQYAELLASGQINEDEFYITTDDEYTTEEIDSMLADKVGIEDVYNKHQVDVKLSKKANQETTYTKIEVDDLISSSVPEITGGKYISVDELSNTYYEYSGVTMDNLLLTNNIITPTHTFEYEPVNIMDNATPLDTPLSEMYYLKINDNLIDLLQPLVKEDGSYYKLYEVIGDALFNNMGVTELTDENKIAAVNQMTGNNIDDATCETYLIKTTVQMATSTDVYMLVYTDKFGNYILGIYCMWNLEPVNIIENQSDKKTFIVDWNKEAIKKFEEFEALPSQTDNAGKALITDGTEASWGFTTVINDMVESVETGLNKLVINKLTSAQYEELHASGLVSPTELYLKTDEKEITKLSELENDVGYLTEHQDISDKADKADTYTKSEVDAKVSSVYRYKGTVANYNSLPSTNLVIGDVYNVEDTGANYAYTGSSWDKLSETFDLTAYATKEEVNTMISNIDLLPSQTDNAGKILTTDGTTASWKNESPAAIFKDW